MPNPRTPVIIGVGQFLNRIESLEQALEPLEMMMRAVRRAEADSGKGGFLDQTQSVRVVRGMWSYENPAAAISERIGAPAAQTVGTLIGGNQNQALLTETAMEILAGKFDLVLITGAENGNSSGKARRAGVALAQTPAPGNPDAVFGAEQRPEHHEYERAKGISRAIQVYPMYDNALRHERGETLDEHITRVSSLWARFNDVAQDNPNAWVRRNMTAEEIRTPSPVNRQISFPYTKFMNANMSVDMAAALILCSLEKAKALGIAEDRLVYPHVGVEGYDHFSASVRDNFYTSPGVRITGTRAMDLAGIDVGDLDFVDLYSCFPSAVQIAAWELGLPEDRPLTVTGGLTFGGGPLNNYVMHSIARTVELLREKPDGFGLVTGNGGNLYKHAHGIYSGTPPRRDFQHDDVKTEIAALPSRECLPEFDGIAAIESYTVMYDNDGPSIGHVSCRTPDGARTWVNTEDPELCHGMVSEEFCGRRVSVRGGQLSVLN
ncbi:MAG: acetyl-CoA acetyltransferase [Gammaproteobacteria bacterium]|nr:acetyl-CoA acetyltransferase [Gammaproteobacteria bacterium]